MSKKVLVMGLPGSGKTFLSRELKTHLVQRGYTVDWFNADDVRKQFDDWDFSQEGRIRQSVRMSTLAEKSECDYVICDFVAPLPEMRDNFNADWTIWMDTIKAGKYEDTNRMFIPPKIYDFRITEQNATKWASVISQQM